MRVLVLGGDGMLGHCLVGSLAEQHEVFATFRGEFDQYAHHGIFKREQSIVGVDALDFTKLESVVRQVKPDFVINAIGLVKQRDSSRDIVLSLEINALLPHRLGLLCEQINARLIHISTDCVFRGDRGEYSENDASDAIDLYGRTKFLGEVTNLNSLTLRTSIIGLELSRKKSLIEWFLRQEGMVQGYMKAIYTGLTTFEIVRVIDLIMTRHPQLSGLYQVASKPISKFDLLHVLNGYLDRDCVTVVPNYNFECDRSLSNTKFFGDTGYEAPAWNNMLQELAVKINGANE